MARSMFHMGIGNGEPWYAGAPSGIPIYNGLTRQDVDRDRGRILRRLPVPPGRTVQYPYIVKIEGEGEYVVQADGTANYYSYRDGRWEPPQAIDSKSTWTETLELTA